VNLEPYEVSPDEIDRGNRLVSTFANLRESERDRYLLQASKLIQRGTLEIFRNDCKLHYELSNNILSFHVNRQSDNTSISGNLPMPNSEEEVVSKMVTAFAHSESLAEN